jgi:hypothetical protein
MDLDVLLPFHRVDRNFEEALISVSASEKISLRLILIDDRTDKSQDLSKNLFGLENFQLVETGGGEGYGKALSIGSNFIINDAVAIMNSDDLVSPNRFWLQLKQLENKQLSIAGLQKINSLGRPKKSITGDLSSAIYDPLYLTLGAYGANASWCMQSSWWKTNSFFDADDCLDWRIALKSFHKTKLGFIADKLYFYRQHKSQFTANRNIDQRQISKIYGEWTNFCNELGIGGYSIDFFSLIALPWVKAQEFSISELSEFMQRTQQYLSDNNPTLARDFLQLLKRRLLLGMRGNISLGIKSDLLRVGFSELPSLLQDIMNLQRTRPFR